MKTRKVSPHVVAELVAAIRPILAGRSPELQGAVLADLVAIFLVGHQGPAADDVREDILQLHIETVRKLIPVNAKMMGLK